MKRKKQAQKTLAHEKSDEGFLLDFAHFLWAVKFAVVGLMRCLLVCFVSNLACFALLAIFVCLVDFGILAGGCCFLYF